MHADVVIIGGGTAGLIAARNLSEQKKKVILLEAGDRFGGRAHTIYDPSFDSLLETGAEFIHGKLPITIGLLKEAGVPYYKTEGIWLFNENGKWHRSDEPSGWDRVLKKMKSLEKDMPLATFLDQHFPGSKDQELKKSIRHYAEGFDLADSHTASTFALRDEWMNEEGVVYRVKGGYSRLAGFLVNKSKQNGVSLRNASVVKQVEWKEKEVKVNTVNGELFTGSKLLIAVPLQALQNGNADNAIQFHPAIPSILTATGKIGYGTVIKIFFQFKEPFWTRHSPDAGFIISNQMIPTWWTQLPYASNMLTGWLGGPPAKALRDASEEIITRLGLESLANIFGTTVDKLGSLLEAQRIIDWSSAPFIHGGYSFATVDTAEARKTLQSPVENTIFFSGEGIYESNSPGTVEAALHAGITAANAILKNG